MGYTVIIGDVTLNSFIIPVSYSISIVNQNTYFRSDEMRTEYFEANDPLIQANIVYENGNDDDKADLDTWFSGNGYNHASNVIVDGLTTIPGKFVFNQAAGGYLAEQVKTGKNQWRFTFNLILIDGFTGGSVPSLTEGARIGGQGYSVSEIAARADGTSGRWEIYGGPRQFASIDYPEIPNADVNGFIGLIVGSFNSLLTLTIPFYGTSFQGRLQNDSVNISWNGENDPNNFNSDPLTVLKD